MARKITAVVIFFMTLIASSILFILFVAPNSKTSESIEKIISPQSIEKPFYTSIGGNIDMTKERQNAIRKSHKIQQSQYTIEFIITASRSEAETIVEDLQKHQIRAYYMPVQKEGQIYYRVRSSLFVTETQAAAELQRLSQNAKINGKVVRL